MKRWSSLVLGCVVGGGFVTGVLAQEGAPKSCEAQLLEARIKVEWKQRLEEKAAEDLGRWITRATAAEQQVQRLAEKPAAVPKAPEAAEGPATPPQGEPKR